MTYPFEAVFDDLDLDEKIALVSGVDPWHTAEIARLGIPSLWMSDGPNGVRGTQLAGSSSAACFPCGLALGATFDPSLVGEIGAALGLEARRLGVHALLGPTLNIVRLPIAGRNFECFSEDPYLAARLAVAYIKGVQSKGVASVAKHFVCNDSERDRYTTSSEVDECALREIYLAPFAAAVLEANAWGVMSGYNLLNGIHACEHPILEEVLKNEWGFNGAVISDWYGTTSTVDAGRAALDLEMPGPPIRWGEKLREAILSGEVPQAALDKKVRRVLRLIDRTNTPEPFSDDGSSPVPLIRRAAAEATVLLRNEKELLPLDLAHLSSIAVIGPNASSVQAHGGGAARVDAPYVVSPVDAIRERCGDGVDVGYEPGCFIELGLAVLDYRKLPGNRGDDALDPIVVEYFDNRDLKGDPVHKERATAMHFAWNGPPTAGLEVGNYSVRLKADLVPQCSGRGLFSIHGVGRMRLLIDDAIVIDNWEEPVVAPILFGRGAGQLTAACELIEEKPLRITVEFQAPEENLSDRALELSPVPPTERENRAFGPAGVTVGYRPPMPEDLLECAEALARASDVVVIVVGTNEDWESEGFDRDSLRLPGDQDELIARITKANSHVVIVLNAGSAIEMPWIKDASSVLQLWLPGQEAGNALADVLFGDVDPSGRLPVSVPVRLQDSGGVVGYPGSDKKLHYVDGINVGYRHFDAAGIEPAFCFGHGLSYTTFSYGPLTIKALPEGGVRAMATVTNSGKRSGTEVAQLYVHDVAATNTRPPCELKGFTKMWLDPGEHAIASFDLPPTAFSFWDSSQHAFTVEAGTFELLVGASSRDIRSRLRFNLGKGGELLD